MLLIRLTGVMPPEQRLPPHDAHQPCGPFAVNIIALLLLPGGKPPDVIKRGFEVLLVQQAHDDQVFLTLNTWGVIQATAMNAEQFALLHQA